MNIQKCFKISAYGMLISGYMALLLTWQLDPLTLSLYGLALAVGWFFSPETSALKPSKFLINALVVLYAIFFVVDYLYLSHDFRAAAIRLIFFVAILKLYTIQVERDYMYLFGSAFLQLLVSTTLTISLSFLAALIAFLVSASATLILFEIKRTARRLRVSGRAGVESARTGPLDPMNAMQHLTVRHLVGVTLVLTLFIVVLAIPIFFMIPRLSIGLLAQPFDQPQLISGFSNRVRLGEIGSIKQNPAVVMRVKVKGADALPPTWKWRGVALDRYDGRTWTQSPVWRSPLSGKPQGWPSNQRIFQMRMIDRNAGETILEQTILLEALNTNVLFANRQAFAITSSDIISLVRDATGTLTLSSPPLSRLRYTVYSTETLTEEIDSYRSAMDRSAAYLSLPSSWDTRIEQLAKDLTQDQWASYAKAQALETYLKTHYTYSLDLKGGSAIQDPLSHFLFTAQAGHCEYFASAMALMLRSLHIPSRMVNGFRLGEFNQIGGDYVVRQSDAHSWVEAFFPDHGWVEFDPTPPDPMSAKSSLKQWAFQIVDALELFWADQVINYDLWRQARAVRDALKSLNSLENSIGDLNKEWAEILRGKLAGATLSPPTFSQVKPVLLWLAGLAAGIMLVIGLRRRPWLFSRNARRRQTLAVEFYSDMLRLLSRYGIQKAKHQTPLEFYRSLEGRREAVYLAAITDSYHKARYSRVAITQEELKRMSACLKQLQNSLRS